MFKRHDFRGETSPNSYIPDTVDARVAIRRQFRTEALEEQSSVPPPPLPFCINLCKSLPLTVGKGYSSFLSIPCLSLSEVGRPLTWAAKGQ